MKRKRQDTLDDSAGRRSRKMKCLLATQPYDVNCDAEMFGMETETTHETCEVYGSDNSEGDDKSVVRYMTTDSEMEDNDRITSEGCRPDNEESFQGTSTDDEDNEDGRERTASVRREVALLPVNDPILHVSAHQLQVGWHCDHIDLFRQLLRHDFQPLVPKSWQNGLDYIPEQLCAGSDEAVLAPKNTSLVQGELALRCLLDMGGWLRVQFHSCEIDLTPEKQVKRSMTTELQRMIPLTHAVVVSKHLIHVLAYKPQDGNKNFITWPFPI